MYEAARILAERGYPVFPVKPNDKRPFPESRGYKGNKSV